MLYSCHASSLQGGSFHWQLEICKHSQCSCPALPCPALPCPALPCPDPLCPDPLCYTWFCSAQPNPAMPLIARTSPACCSNACKKPCLQPAATLHLTHNHFLSCNAMCISVCSLDVVCVHLFMQSWLKVTTQLRVHSVQSSVTERLQSVVFFAVSTMFELASRGQDPD